MMKFIVDYSGCCEQKHVIYRENEYSFDTILWLNEIDFEYTHFICYRFKSGPTQWFLWLV